MAELDITFQNEQGTNLNRYKVTNVSTGEETIVDLARNGTISQQGTPLDANTMNAIVAAINSKVDKIDGYTLTKNDYSDDEKSNVASNTSARHTHSNKSLLDTYDQTNANLMDAVSKKHSHSNKSILDNTQESFTTQQKNKIDNLDNDYQAKIDNNNKLSSDLVDDNNKSNKFVTQAMYNWLDDQLYQQPQITAFTVQYGNGVTIPTSNEVGSTFSANTITYTLTNLSNVSGNLTLTVGGTTQTITPSSSDVVNLTSAISVSSNTTFTLSGTDTKGNTFSKTYSITFSSYTYTKATSSSTAPTSSLIKQTSSSYDITYASGDYIYFYNKSSGKSVQQNVLGTWTTLSSTNLGQVTITQNNGATGTYYCYRIGAFANGGTDTFRLA